MVKPHEDCYSHSQPKYFENHISEKKYYGTQTTTIQMFFFLFLRLPAASQFYREAYICDTKRLTQRLQSLTSSMSDCSAAVETNTAWSKDDDEEEEGHSATGQLKGK